MPGRIVKARPERSAGFFIAHSHREAIMAFLSHNSFLARLERCYVDYRRSYPPRAAFRAAWALTDWRLP